MLKNIKIIRLLSQGLGLPYIMKQIIPEKKGEGSKKQIPITHGGRSLQKECPISYSEERKNQGITP